MDLKELRAKLGITQKEAVEKLKKYGITLRSWQSWEQGWREIPKDKENILKEVFLKKRGDYYKPSKVVYSIIYTIYKGGKEETRRLTQREWAEVEEALIRIKTLPLEFFAVYKIVLFKEITAFDIMLEAPKDLTKWITDVEVVKMNDAKEFNYPYDIRHLPLVISMDYKRVNSENLLNS